MQDAHDWVRGRELDVLHALGIQWTPGARRHIRCPFPDHDDKNPSWRWDSTSARWFCTCGDGSCFDAVTRMRGGDFKDAIQFAREVLDGALPIGGYAAQGQSLPRNKSAVNQKPEAPAVQHVLAATPPRNADLEARIHIEDHASLPNGWHSLGLPKAWWMYLTADREIFEIRARYDGLKVEEVTGKKKEVMPWIWDGKKWRNKAAPAPRPLYRLPELLSDPDAPVLFVEGEKTADRGGALFQDFVATTTSGGSNQHRHTDYTPLKGRKVWIWPDNDHPYQDKHGAWREPAGPIYAAAIAQHAHDAGAAEIYMVDVPKDWPDGWDLADEPPSDSVDLRDMLEDAKPWQPPQQPAQQAQQSSATRNVAPPQQAPAAPGNSSGNSAAPKPFKFPFIRLADIKPVLTGQWLIKGLLPAKGLAIVYGPSGCGKSFLALNAALHIATGRPWADRKTYPAAVVYIAAEGQQGFANRVYAARNKLGVPDDTPFVLITGAPNLGTLKGDAGVLIEEVKAQCAALGIVPGMIVIDTLAQTMFGADESGPEGMGAFIANCGQLARELDCLAMAVHHIGKVEANGMRGWSGLHGAADAEWEVSDKDGKRSVLLEKSKESQGKLTWDFALETVEIGRDEDDEAVTTCVAPITSPPQQKDQPKNVARPALKGQRATAFEAIKWAIEDMGEAVPGAGRAPGNVRGVTRDKLKLYMQNKGLFEGKTPSAARAVMSRHIADLGGNKYIGHWEKWVWLL
jgi:hypothetical protein